MGSVTGEVPGTGVHTVSEEGLASTLVCRNWQLGQFHEIVTYWQ